MSTPALVDAFYTRIWNDGDVAAAEELLADTFVFRGSLGAELRGRDQFLDYVRMVRSALDGYRCDILECVREDDRAFARMRFSGRHVGEFRGFAPTRKPVAWAGAAQFRFERDRIAELWVLGDLAGLDAMLRDNQAPTR